MFRRSELDISRWTCYQCRWPLTARETVCGRCGTHDPHAGLRFATRGPDGRQHCPDCDGPLPDRAGPIECGHCHRGFRGVS